MALKPTIYKANVVLSDLTRDYYDQLDLTIAQHPSENTERMMVRLLAYCLNAEEGIAFTAGLSTPDEPDVVIKSLDDQVQAWIDVGEPSFDRIKKACNRAGRVCVYSFNSKSEVWWRQDEARFSALPASFHRFEWSEVQALAALVQRTMGLTITVSENLVMVADDNTNLELSLQDL